MLALLYKNLKCKALGIGSWRAKTDWPLNFVQTVKEIKIFGIVIKDSYSSIIKTNWELRFQKFASCIKSWSGRNLPSLSSRIDVLKIFALSRVFYVGSILPITKTMVSKFESLMGKFIWKFGGWLLRIPIDEAKNDR